MERRSFLQWLAGLLTAVLSPLSLLARHLSLPSTIEKSFERPKPTSGRRIEDLLTGGHWITGPDGRQWYIPDHPEKEWGISEEALELWRDNQGGPPENVTEGEEVVITTDKNGLPPITIDDCLEAMDREAKKIRAAQERLSWGARLWVKPDTELEP